MSFRRLDRPLFDFADRPLLVFKTVQFYPFYPLDRPLSNKPYRPEFFRNLHSYFYCRIVNFSWVLFCESVITGSHAVIMHVRIWIYSNVTLLNSLFTRLAMHFIWTRHISFSNYNLPNPIYLQPICPRPCPQFLVYVRNIKQQFPCLTVNCPFSDLQKMSL